MEKDTFFKYPFSFKYIRIYMGQIPKIIHQIWSGIEEPLPWYLEKLGETWKRDYPEWVYRLWDNQQILQFLHTYYPHYIAIYEQFPYNIQRWDAIRYLILEKIGGMYVDFDYESLLPIDSLLKNRSCCFASEPESHYHLYSDKIDYLFNNALMACAPDHPFMKKIVARVFSKEMLTYEGEKTICVLNTTGPITLIKLYQELSEKEKEDVYLIPAKFVTPLDSTQVNQLKMGVENEDMDMSLENAYAVHYFFSYWIKTTN